MFNSRRTPNEVDTSLFDPEHDMDLVALINNARTEREVESVAHMSRARMRSRRRAQLDASIAARRGESRRIFSVIPGSLIRGL